MMNGEGRDAAGRRRKQKAKGKKQKPKIERTKDQHQGAITIDRGHSFHRCACIL
jgi:hypothetical protein